MASSSTRCCGPSSMRIGDRRRRSARASFTESEIVRMRKRATVASCAAGCLMALAAPAFGQNQDALRAYFEGQRVTVKIDMPGTSDGIDVRANETRAIDYKRYGDRLKNYGTAIHAGDSTVVT